jgi:predicted permease
MEDDMRPLSTAWRRVRAVFERNRIEHDMDREMRAHLDLLAEEYERSGLSPDDARMAAKRRFGNTGHLKERGRDVRGAGLLEDLARDFAYAVRTYRRSPILAAVIILSLALGIGANTALFSVVDAAYLRKLPVPEPDQLVGFLWRAANWRPDDLRWSASTTGDSDSPGIEIVSSPAFSRTAYAAFRANAADLQDTFAFGRRTGASVTIDGESDATTVQAVSGSYFGGLGVQATLGRPLTDEDDREAASPVALLSHPAWQSRFGGDPAALGRSILLNGAPFTIVGVAAEEFTGTDGLGAADFFVPLPFETEATGARIEANTWSIKTMGRLRPGVVPEQVRARLSGVFRGTAGEAAARAPADDALQLEVVSSSRVEPDLSFGGPADQVVYLLTAVFMVLLLVVCMNVANLLTARAATRRYEIGVRFAFGAGRRRLIRQLLTESLLLGVAGGAAGIGVAYWAKDVLASVMDRPLDLEINPSVLGFALAVSVVTGLLFGLLPAVQASRRDLYGSVQNNSRTPGRSRSWATATLLTAQVVLCVVILTGAGMLVRTLGQLPSADAGFDTSNLIAFRVNLAPLDGDRVKYNAMVDAIRAVPGVVGVGSESEILVTNSGNRTDGFQPRASGPNGDVR